MGKQKKPVTNGPIPVDYDELFHLAWSTHTSRFKEIVTLWVNYRLQLTDYCYVTGRTSSFAAAVKESFRRTRGTFGRYALLQLILNSWLILVYGVMSFEWTAPFTREIYVYMKNQPLFTLVLSMAIVGVAQPFFGFAKLIFKSSYFGGPVMERFTPVPGKRRREPEQAEL